MGTINELSDDLLITILSLLDGPSLGRGMHLDNLDTILPLLMLAGLLVAGHSWCQRSIHHGMLFIVHVGLLYTFRLVLTYPCT
jgi:hypothetical protein